jgi:myo-inositol-1(or 4)-monophosphatase
MSLHNPPLSLELLTLEVNKIVRQVALFIAQQAQAFDSSRVEYKGKNDLVSYVDKEAERRLINALKALLPEAGFIAEESVSVQQLSDKEHHWIIDPLDGTTNFVHQLPVYAISIALVQGQDLVLGVVYEVNRKECFYAWKGGGAYCNGLPMHCSKATSLSQGLLATGFPYYDFTRMPYYLGILEDLMQQSHGLRRLGSAAVDLAYVACGRFEAFFEYNLQAWDVAAGALLVQEAGGLVSDFGGGQSYLFGKEILAAAPALQAHLLEVIQKHWPKEVKK